MRGHADREPVVETHALLRPQEVTQTVFLYAESALGSPDGQRIEAERIASARLEDRPWLVGGVIPRQDREAVRKLGFAGVFPTGSSFDEIAEFIRENTPHER